MQLSDALVTRRSHKVFRGTAVPDADLRHCVEMAIWAPNHKFTEPWRFSVLPKRSFAALQAAVTAAAVSDKARAKLGKLQEIIDGAGGAIAVRQQLDGDAERQLEDYAACAIACQHIQLAAWERGWASYWTTSPGFVGDGARGTLADFWHVGANERLVGVLFLGEAALAMPAVRRHAADTITDWL